MTECTNCGAENATPLSETSDMPFCGLVCALDYLEYREENE